MTVNDRLEAAALKAESASEIMRHFANGPAGDFVSTESGDLPTIAEWLEQQAAAIGDLGAYVRRVSSVAVLRTTAGRFANDQAMLLGYYAGTPGIGGGPVYWLNSSTAPDDGVTVFAVDGVAIGRWHRPVEGKVYLDWAGILGDGVTLEDAKIRAAVAAVPSGGELIYPDRDMTILVDIPAGSTRPSAVQFNKPMTVRGNRRCKTKVKDFCDAYVNGVGVISIDPYQITSSDVTVDGLYVDANADHHYEINGAHKYWEEGPAGKRPPNGIVVQAQVGQPKLTGVRVRNCVIYRPLGGVVASGTLSFGGPSLDEAAFLNGTLTTDIVEDCVFENNTVIRSRGNCYLFIAGVRSSVVRDNKSFDSQYHTVRFYAAVIDCQMHDNHGYTDYVRLEALYNATDLGYWRTTDTAYVQYKIERTGFAVGSDYVNSAANTARGGNVTDIECSNNTMTYRQTASVTATVNIALIQDYRAYSVFRNVVFTGNKSINCPGSGLGSILSTLEVNNIYQGVVFSRNTIVNATYRGATFIGSGLTHYENEYINCTTAASGEAVVDMQGDQKCYKNQFTWQRGAAVNANPLMKVAAYGPAGFMFISDNVISAGHTGVRLSNPGAVIVHGSDGGGVFLTLLNGWSVAQAGTASIRNDLKVFIDCSGTVTLEGFVSVTGSTADTIFQLNSIYYPPQNKYIGVPKVPGNVTPYLFILRVTQSGAGIIDRLSQASGDLTVNCSWKSNFRI